MSFGSDLMVDRRKLRRQVTFWRIVAFLIAVSAIIGAGMALQRSGLGGDHIARIRVDGLITGSQTTIDLLRRADQASAKAVILRINSGGGTTAGSELFYNEVKRLAAKKPVIAVIDGVGASGAYMTALGANRIIANGSAMVGSIGVIAQFPNVTQLLDKLGVKVEAVRSSPLKAMPNGIEPTTPESRAAIEATVKDSYAWFKSLVGDARALSGEALDKVTDGRVFTGRQAVDLKLIDALGDELDALAWLRKEKGIAESAKIRAYTANTNRFPNLTSMSGVLSFLTGTPQRSIEDQARALLGPGALDGLVSVWHPSRE